MSQLPPLIVDTFLKKVNNQRTNARLGCNILVYWSSCNYKDRNEVLKCVNIIRTLGYTTLADKLEIDRCECRIQEKDGKTLTAYVGTSVLFHKDLEKIPDGEIHYQDKIGRKVRFDFPKSRHDHFFCVLGRYYGRKLAIENSSKGNRMWAIIPTTWQQLRAFTNPAPPVTAPPVHQAAEVRLQVKGHWVQVQCPYNNSFLSELKNRIPSPDRQWTGSQWLIRTNHFMALTDMLQRFYL